MTAQTVEHLYSPETNLERSELDQLDTATRNVDVAMYSFTDRYLAEELAVLAHRGVVSVATGIVNNSNKRRSGAV